MNTAQINHIGLWGSIFKNDDWANKVMRHGFYPALICYGNYKVLVLVANTEAVSNREQSHADALLRSLKSNSFSESTLEVEFEDFVLNTSYIFEHQRLIDVKEVPAANKVPVTIAYYMDPLPATHTICPSFIDPKLVIFKLARYPHRGSWMFIATKEWSQGARRARARLGNLAV